MHGDRACASGGPRGWAKSSKCWSAPTGASSAGCTRSTACCSSCPRTGASPLDILIPPDRGRARQAGRRWRPSNWSRSPPSTRSRSAASPRCSATTPIRAWRSRSRCASSTCRTNSRRRRWRWRARCRTKCAPEDVQGPARPARPAVRHHRRRNGEGFRRRGARGARGQGLPAARGDRRRQPLRAPRRRAGRRCARARHLGLLPAPRDPDAAGEALQRPVLAQSERRPPGDGLRHGDHAGRQGRALRVLRGGVPLACAPDLHRRLGNDFEGQGERRTCRPCTRCYKVAGARSAAAAARSTSRSVETKMEFDARGKILRIVPEPRNEAHRLIEECMLAANVCAGNFLAERGHPVLYRVHDVPAPEKVTALRDFLAELGLVLPGGEKPKPKDYAQLLEKIQPRPDFALLQTILLRSLKQAVYTPGEPRPLRPRLRRLRAFHLADPPLSRPAGAPRDQGGAREPEIRRRRLGRARPPLLGDRAPRRRREPRRRELAQVLLHAGPRRRASSRAPSPASPPSACS